MNSKKNRRDIQRRKELFYAGLIIILVILIVLFSFGAYNNYTIYRGHRAYFNQPNNGVQPWMTVQGVSVILKVPSDTVFREINITNSLTNQRLNIGEICVKYKLNCTQVINGLNSLR
jgi:hypothetical protein